MATLYKIMTVEEWETTQETGTYPGAPVDLADGFVHFSTAEQVRETAAKHFAGQTGLKLASVDEAELSAALTWEPSRGGALFPHLYGTLTLAQCQKVVDLPLDVDGTHIFPDEVTR